MNIPHISLQINCFAPDMQRAQTSPVNGGAASCGVPEQEEET
jgi:hypothetical protein